MPGLPSIESLLFPEAKQPYIWVYHWASVSATIRIQGFTKHGTFHVDIPTVIDRSSQYTSFRLPDIPLAANIGIQAGPVRRGQVYVSVYLQMAGFSVATLMRGYLTDQMALFWPPGNFEGCLEGRGMLRSILGTDPAAGAEIAEAVPVNACWDVKGLRVSLLTSAAVANRQVTFYIEDGANVIYQTNPAAIQAASVTRIYELAFADKVDENAFDLSNITRLYIPSKFSRLYQGWRILTSTIAWDAGDNWAAPRIDVEEWIEE